MLLYQYISYSPSFLGPKDDPQDPAWKPKDDPGPFSLAAVPAREAVNMGGFQWFFRRDLRSHGDSNSGTMMVDCS